MGNRLIYIDALRGFAMLLVIVGHLIQFNYSTGIENPIFNIIYSFHMPLFFFISGYVHSLSKKCTPLEFIKKRVRHLILPAITWTCIVPVFFSYKKSFVSFDFYQYWFMYVLFAIEIGYFGMSNILNIIKREKATPLIAIIIVIALILFDFKKIPAWYFFMFAFGYIIATYKVAIKLKYLNGILSFIFLLTCGYFNYGSNPAGESNRIWLMIPLSISASLVLLNVFRQIRSEYFNRYLSYIGRYTLGIYLCHFSLLKIPGINYIETLDSNVIQIVLLFVFACTIAYICIGIQKIVENIPILNTLMYGK